LAFCAGRANLAEVAGNLCSIFRTETIRELTNTCITKWGPIGICIYVAGIFIRAIITIFVTVAEKTSGNAVAIPAS